MKVALESSCLALAIALCSASSANAQSQEAAGTAVQSGGSEDYDYDVIVVTAQGRVQVLSDVPVSASVVSGESLERQQIRNLEELSTRLPNVRIATAPVSDFINIRGIGSSLNLGFEQSVATFVDGSYRGRARATRAALFDIERVEVLKGPQTTFFGNNAIAGALNITTRKPGNEASQNASLSYIPSTQTYSAELGITVPVADNLSFRVAGKQYGTEGYIYNEYLDRTGPDTNNKVGRLSLAWEPTSRVRVDARIDAGRSRERGQAFSELIDCPPDPAYGAPAASCARYLAASGGQVDDELDRRSAGGDSFFDYDFLEMLGTISVDLGAHTFISRTSHFEHDIDQANENVPIPPNMGGSVVPGTTQSFGALFMENYDYTSQEFRIQSAEDQAITYLAGVFYAKSNLDLGTYLSQYIAPFANFSEGLIPANTPTGNLFLGEEEQDVYSAFGAVTFRIQDNLRINTGLRYSKVDKTASRSMTIGTTDGTLARPGNYTPAVPAAQAAIGALTGVVFLPFPVSERGDEKLMPTVGAQYDVGDTMLYATYTNGFKAGGFSYNATNNSVYEPETVDAYEVGIKSTLLDRRLSLNLALFQSDYKGLQETATIGTPTGSTIQVAQNVGSARSRGVEASMRFTPITGLTIAADVAYLDATFVSYPNAPCTVLQRVQSGAACTQDLSGSRRPFAPEVSGNASVGYEIAVLPEMNLSFNITTYFSSRFYQQPTIDELLQQSGYAKLDARIALAHQDGWEFAVIGQNLTDRQTASYRQISTSAGSYQALADLPRSVGFQLSFRN